MAGKVHRGETGPRLSVCRKTNQPKGQRRAQSRQSDQPPPGQGLSRMKEMAENRSSLFRHQERAGGRINYRRETTARLSGLSEKADAADTAFSTMQEKP